MEPLLQVHDYWEFPNRFDIVSEWWRKRRLPGIFEETILPKLAVFITADGVPVAFGACDMSNSIGKATLEHAITVPGLSLAEARRALLFLEEVLVSALKAIGHYSLLVVHTQPGIAKTLERRGWTRRGSVVELARTI